jgi:hypothetical protein
MSKKRITLPITIPEYRLGGADYLPASGRDALEHPESAEYRWMPMEHRLFGLLDPWGLRELFLECPVESWRGFLERAGMFGPGVFRISQKSFEEWQRLLREAMITSPSKWRLLEKRFDPQKVNHLLSYTPIRFEWDGETPIMKMASNTALETIIASIQLDALEGAKFRLCARHDCNAAPFRVENRLKVYCSHECAHLAAVRRSRETKTGKRKDRRRGRL